MGEAARIAANPCRITRCRMLARIIIVFIVIIIMIIVINIISSYRRRHRYRRSSSLRSLSFSIYLTRSSHSLSFSLYFFLHTSPALRLAHPPVVISLFAPKHQFFSDHRSHCPLLLASSRTFAFLTRTLGPNATLTHAYFSCSHSFALSLSQSHRISLTLAPHPLINNPALALPLTRARSRPFVPYEKDCKPLTQ